MRQFSQPAARARGGPAARDGRAGGIGGRPWKIGTADGDRRHAARRRGRRVRTRGCEGGDEDVGAVGAGGFAGNCGARDQRTPALLHAGAVAPDGLLFSIVPAVQAARASLNDALKQGGRGGIGGRGRSVRDVLVVLEVAAALVLLVGAGLLLETLAKLRAIDIGFRSDHL